MKYFEKSDAKVFIIYLMEDIQVQGLYEKDNFNVVDSRSSTPNSEYFLYDFQEKDLDYNWIPLYYSFVEPWDYEPHLKPDSPKSVTNDTKFVNKDDNESDSNDDVVRQYKKTRRGHAAGKRKRMQGLRRRGEKRLNVNAEVTDQPNAKRAKEEQDSNVKEIEEEDNMAAVLGGLDVVRQPEAQEEEVPIYWSWEKRGRGL